MYKNFLSTTVMQPTKTKKFLTPADKISMDYSFPSEHHHTKLTNHYKDDIVTEYPCYWDTLYV